MSLGERIARLRKQREWTQDDLGERIGVHPRHVSRLENDKMKPSGTTLSRLAQTFELSVDELLAEDGETPTIRDPQLLRTFHQAQELDDQDRAMLVRLIQALLTRKRVEQALDLPA